MGNAFSLIQSLFDALGKIGEFLSNSSKQTRVVLAVVAAVLAAVGLLVAGHFMKAPWSSPAAERDLGGVDVAGYCDSYGFDSGSIENCEARINLGDACDWQYGMKGAHIAFGSKDPHSGVCYTEKDRRLGGIKDMDGYCARRFKDSADVTSRPEGSRTWICETGVEMKLVCGWQYQKVVVTAHRNSGGNWRCYEKRS
ncbi:hypothetical protein [Streptomyces sp. NPDC050560]|uniref:hypothetical protein n=1 Tax=Streptomyces sp. NPDC050560 TaxID=3365630 RepID=UPI003799D225